MPITTGLLPGGGGNHGWCGLPRPNAARGTEATYVPAVVRPNQPSIATDTLAADSLAEPMYTNAIPRVNRPDHDSHPDSQSGNRSTRGEWNMMAINGRAGMVSEFRTTPSGHKRTVKAQRGKADPCGMPSEQHAEDA